MPDIYYRRLRSTGVWHIVSWERGGRDMLTLCHESFADASEGYAPARGQRVDPPGLCPTCKLLADGAKQLTLLEVSA